VDDAGFIWLECMTDYTGETIGTVFRILPAVDGLTYPD